MKVLIIKTSSMGDVIHTLPALTDAGHAIATIRFDWMVEEAFKEIPAWHPLVDRVIPISFRRWRKNIFSGQTYREWQALISLVKAEQYDLILDAQGLIKSAFLTFFCQGKRAGLDRSSAREALASLVYQQKHRVNFFQHAIIRMRQLFSLALNYSFDGKPDFGIDASQFEKYHDQPYLVFLHSTTWQSKQWPEEYWKQLTHLASREGYRIKINGGNDEELARADRIAKNNEQVETVGKVTILEMAKLLANAEGAIAVDTGFGHLSAALNVPTLSLYSSTKVEYTGAIGKHSRQLSTAFSCSPCLNRHCQYREFSEVEPACFAMLPPKKVWHEMQKLLIEKDKRLSHESILS